MYAKAKNTSFLWVFHKFTLYSNWISRDTGVNWDIREIHILLLWAPRQNLTPMGALFQSYYSGFLGLYVIGLHNGRKGIGFVWHWNGKGKNLLEFELVGWFVGGRGLWNLTPMRALFQSYWKNNCHNCTFYVHFLSFFDIQINMF